MSLPSYEPGFDYGQLPAEWRGEVRDAAARIKGHLVRSLEGIAAVGQELIAVHDAIGDGAFGRWIDAEFSMGRTTATTFMQVYRRFGVDLTKFVKSTPSVVYLLAAPETPDEIVDQVVEMQQAGEKVTVADVKAMKAQWKEERGKLRKEIADLKLKRQSATASTKGLAQQLQEMSQENADLRGQLMARDAHDKLKAAKAEPPTITATYSEASAGDDDRDAEARDRWLASGMAWWECGSKEWREAFVARVQA